MKPSSAACHRGTLDRFNLTALVTVIALLTMGFVVAKEVTG